MPIEKAMTYGRLPNHRGAKFYTHNGKTQTVSQWAKDLGITRSAFKFRLKHYPDNAFFKGRLNVFKPHKKVFTINGETHSIREWAHIKGVNDSCVRRRLAKGQPIEQALAPLKQAPAPKKPTGGPSKTFNLHPMTGRPRHVHDFDS